MYVSKYQVCDFCNQSMDKRCCVTNETYEEYLEQHAVDVFDKHTLRW